MSVRTCLINGRKFIWSRVSGLLGSWLVKMSTIVFVRSVSSGSVCLVLFPVQILQITLLAAFAKNPYTKKYSSIRT